MPHYKTLEEAPSLKGKRVILRAGFDVSIEDGKIMDRERIDALVPTMQHILKEGASLVIISHQGRPKGKRNMEYTQEPVKAVLEEVLERNVLWSSSCIGAEAVAMAKALQPGQVLFCENLRFEPGEEANDPAFAQELMKLGEIYVNDAFTNCHRNHASMVALAELLPAFAGLQLTKELRHLGEVLDDPKRPLALIVSGAKMETKVPIIEQFLDTGDDILVGGCIANTFIAAKGLGMGTSKFEQEFAEKAQSLVLESEKPDHANIHIPLDVVVASKPAAGVKTNIVSIDGIPADMAVFDIGTMTVERYRQVLSKAKMIVWNGPMGLFEVEEFAEGSKKIAEAVSEAARNGATTIIGGGDTIDFHTRYGLSLDAYSFVSTGGGAMLEYIAGKPLPALKPLEVVMKTTKK
jgi:3-phosphoglycerate kinase